MSATLKGILGPVFLALVAVQAGLAFLVRSGEALRISGPMLSGIRLTLALAMLAILAYWMATEWRGRP
jgi:hypothetical protein